MDPLDKMEMKTKAREEERERKEGEPAATEESVARKKQKSTETRSIAKPVQLSNGKADTDSSRAEMQKGERDGHKQKQAWQKLTGPRMMMV